MEKELIYSLELTQSELEGIIAALDSVVKTNGLTVAEKCSQIHKSLLLAKPVEPSESVEPNVSLEEVEEELKQIIEVPKKKKSSSKRKK